MTSSYRRNIYLVHILGFLTSLNFASVYFATYVLKHNEASVLAGNHFQILKISLQRPTFYVFTFFSQFEHSFTSIYPSIYLNTTPLYLSIYLCIYLYLSVCVCVCVCDDPSNYNLYVVVQIEDSLSIYLSYMLFITTQTSSQQQLY